SSAPCSIYNYTDYANKQKRFIQDQGDVPNANSAASNYQYYQYTGQCPTSGSLQNFLSTLILQNDLTATSLSLTTIPQFTIDLYDEIVTGGYVSLQWQY